MASLTIGGVDVAPGTRQTINLPVARLYTDTEMSMPVHVLRGRRPGARLFVSAAVHGNELNGVEIVRRLLALRLLERLRGTLLLVPVVNVYGFIGRTRYLPDRRDLNRFFPGSPNGSLASRLAHLFMEEIVAHSTHGIDLHTGAIHRTNVPQIRAGLDDAETRRLAQAFDAPVMLDAHLRDGSMRQAVLERGLPILLYEGGEALRLDETAIRVGLRGVVAVMRALNMLPGAVPRRARPLPLVAGRSTWVRAPQSGMLIVHRATGSLVQEGAPLGTINAPLGDTSVTVRAPRPGILIGRTTLPLVHEGEALFHIAQLTRPEQAAEALERLAARPDQDLTAFVPGAPDPDTPLGS